MAEVEAQGLLQAHVLDGKGGARAIAWPAVLSWKPSDGFLWVHLDATHEKAAAWIRGDAAVGEGACEQLLAEQTRPMSRELEGGLLVLLRGVNLNPGADPEDMVALRLWVDAGRMISLSRRRLIAIDDLAAELEGGRGPVDSAELLTSLAGHLFERMVPVLEELGEAVDGLEARAVTEPPSQLQAQLAELRLQIIALRRHLVPQRDAMGRLGDCAGSFMSPETQADVLALHDQVTRYVEGLGELRERTVVTHDLLSSRHADAMNSRMLLLSIITAIFLPLGLLTGLLGVNVGGIPGATNEWGFYGVCVLLALLAGLQLYALKRLKWF